MGVVTSESLQAHLADESVPMYMPTVPPPEPIPAAATAAPEAIETPITSEETVQDEAQAPGEGAEQYTARVQKRINKLVRERKEEEEFAQSQFNRARAAEREADELRAQLASKSVSPTTAQAAEDKKPDAKTYVDPALTQEERSAKYEEDLLAWNRRETIRQYRDEQAQATARAEAVAKDEAFGKQIAEFEKENPGFGETLRASAVSVPNAAMAAISESPIGVHIADYLIKNPAEAERLKPMSPARAAAEIGKLEERLSKPAATPAVAAPPPAKSRAPAPIEPITAPSAPVTADPSKMSVSELREYHRSRAGENRGRKRH
jgi:hypothetical protein